MQNTHMDSGDNTNNNYIRYVAKNQALTSTYSSIFTYDFEVSGTNNASLSFEYQVDAERG